MAVYIDARRDQPLGPDGTPAAPARVRARVHGKETQDFLEWPSGDGGWIDSRSLVLRAKQHLASCGVERREFILQAELIDLVARTPEGLISPVNAAMRPVWTIVSLQPLVLIETPGTIQSFSHVQAQPPRSRPKPGEAIAASVFLNGGFHYGLHAPYTPEPRWASPEAGDKILISRAISPTERIIDHPTRPLRLMREGELWRAELAGRP